jgi:DNA-directed RNA polymerase specialized sigma24 family protein
MSLSLAIIIPHKNNNELLFKCLKSIQDKTKFKNYHIYIADTGSDKNKFIELQNFLKDHFAKTKNVSLVSFDYYNFAKINNTIVEKYVKDEDFKNDPNSDEDFTSLWDSEPKKKKKRVRRTKAELKPNYVDPIEMENLIIQYYEQGGKDIPSDLADMIQKIATRLGYANNFINYSYKEEMIGDAIIKMITAVTRQRFKCKSGYNPFSYFTKVAYRAFQNRIKKEKKEHDTIHRYQNEVYTLLTESGQIPSQKNTKLDTDNLSLELVENHTTPKHKKIKISDLLDKKINLENISEELQNNFVSLCIDRNVNEQVLNLMLSTFNQYKPKHIRTDFNIFEAVQLSATELNEISIDIDTALHEFVNLLDTPVPKKDILDKCIDLYRISQTINEH